MATILIPGPTTDGCSNCADVDPEEEWRMPPYGYVELHEWDEQGPYTYLGRCFYCNHRDRHEFHKGYDTILDR